VSNLVPELKNLCQHIWACV